MRKEISGAGVLRLERVQVICPACGQQVEAVATEGRVKGYCAVAKQYVEFLVETQRVGIGKPHTAETREKLPTAIKKHWQDPEYRAKQSAGMKKHWQDPKYRAKQSAGMKKHWQDPESQAKQSAGIKKHWQDPEYRAAHIGKHRLPETKAKISVALRRWHSEKSEPGK